MVALSPVVRPVCQIPAKRARLKLAVFDHNLFSLDGEVCDCIINLDPILRQAKEEAMPVERKKTTFKLASTGEHAGEPRGEVRRCSSD